jgi:hypothetical protein
MICMGHHPQMALIRCELFDLSSISFIARIIGDSFILSFLLCYVVLLVDSWNQFVVVLY